MKKEAEQPRRELLLEEVALAAQATLLHDGYHIPTVIADGSATTGVLQVPDLAATHEKRAQQLFLSGFFLAVGEPIGGLRQAFFISEAWMSLPQGGALPAVPPSQDPERKEVLAIAQLRLRDRASHLVILEMIRDEAGELTVLRPFEPPTSEATEVDNPLLRAFVAGFEAGRGQRLG